LCEIKGLKCKKSKGEFGGSITELLQCLELDVVIQRGGENTRNVRENKSRTPLKKKEATAIKTQRLAKDTDDNGAPKGGGGEVHYEGEKLKKALSKETKEKQIPSVKLWSWVGGVDLTGGKRREEGTQKMGGCLGGSGNGALTLPLRLLL